MTQPCYLTRRQLVGAGFIALAYPLLGGCTSAAPTESAGAATADDAITQRDGLIEVDTARVPQWTSTTAPDVAVVFLAARVIVVRRSRTEFLALSADCPHAGCGVSVVQPPRLLCPCHGSEFDFEGRRLVGPAPTGLRVLAAVLDEASGRLRIQRS